MGLFDRLGKIITGTFGVAAAPTMLVWDLGYQLGDDPSEFLGAITDRTAKRGAEFLGAVFGPQGGIGSTIGALPDNGSWGVRAGPRSIIHPIMQGSEWVYSKGVSHPLATLLKVGSLTESEMWQRQTGKSDWGIFFDPHSWGSAWKMTNHTSPGQALAENINFALLPMISHDIGQHEMGGRDIMDVGEANKFAGTDFYKATSGLFDAYLRWTKDPQVLVGNKLTDLRIEKWDRPFRYGAAEALSEYKGARRAGASVEEATAAGREAGIAAHSTQVENYLKSDRWFKYQAELERLHEQYPDLDSRIGAIKDQLHASHDEGMHIAVDQARATTAAEREFVARVHMGDNSVLTAIQDANPELGESMRLDFENAGMVKNPSYTMEYHQSPAYRPDSAMQAAIETIADSPEAKERLQNVFGKIGKESEMRAPGPLGQTRIAAKNSEWFQNSAWTKPLRVFTDNVSTNIIDLTDYNHVDQVERALREAGLSYEDRLAWVGRIANTPMADRLGVIQEAERAGILHIAKEAGVHPEDLQQILDGGEQFRGAAKKALDNAKEKGDGTFEVMLPGLDESTVIPTRVMPENAYPLTPMRELKKEFGFWRRHNLDDTIRAPQLAMNSAMKVWRAGVLLRPAWPIRVVGEGGIAMMAKLDDLSYGMHDLRGPIVKYADWKKGTIRTYKSLSEELGYGYGGGTGAIFGGLVAGPLGALVGAPIGVGVQMLGRSLEEIPFEGMVFNGAAVHGAFGAALDKNNLWKHHTSSRFDIDNILRRKKFDERAMTLSPAEERVSTLPTSKHFPKRYEEAVAAGQPDPLLQVVLSHDAGVPTYKPAGLRFQRYEDPEHTFQNPDLPTHTGAEIGEMWLQNTPEGKAYAAKNPVLAADPRAWAESISQLAHELTAGDPRLQVKFLAGEKVTYQDLLNAIRPDEAWSHDIVDRWIHDHYGITDEIADSRGIMMPGDAETLAPLTEENPRWIFTRDPAEMLVPIDKIATIQDFVNPERVKELIKDPHVGAGQKAWVIKVNDHYILMDGNHRLNAAIARGEKHIAAEVRVMDSADNGVYIDPDGRAIARPRLNRGAAKAKAAAVEARIKADIENYHAQGYAPTPLAPNAATPDFGKMPTLNKEFQAQIQGNSRRIIGIKSIVDNLFKGLGTIPIDNLIHDRFFSWVYNREMMRKMSGIDPRLVGEKMQLTMEEASRRTALKEMRDVMYNFANRSEFSEMVSMVMPFFPAWQETLHRWAGIAYENPTAIVHGKQILDAPHKMGITWKDENTGDEYVRFRIPSAGRALLNHGFLKGALDDQGYARFQTSGLSMAGQGTPGFGPFVDVALQPFVRDHPDLVKSLKFVYPFGTIPDSAFDSFLPPAMQRLRAVTDDDARSARSAYNHILVTRLVKMDRGEIPQFNLADPGERAQFLDDVHKEAQQFSMMRFVVGALAPAALQYDSPYEPLMEKYKELLHTDPLHAQDRFLDAYGDDFFHLTQAMTKLNNGIPATIEGDQEYQKYQDLVQRYPELGGLITGQDGAGSAAEFNAIIYQKQRTTPVRPGSDIMMRTQLSPEEIVRTDDARLGWIKFTRTMDLIDAEMAQRGLSNFNQSGAEDLQVLKDVMTTSIARSHPAWYAEYSQRDDVAWDNKIAAMEEITKDHRLSSRGDIEQLQQYLGIRRAIMAILQTRESSSIESASNADLQILMEMRVNQLKQGSLAFSQLYNRYLIHDPLTTTGLNTIGVNA